MYAQSCLRVSWVIWSNPRFLESCKLFNWLFNLLIWVLTSLFLWLRSCWVLDRVSSWEEMRRLSGDNAVQVWLRWLLLCLACVFFCFSLRRRQHPCSLIVHVKFSPLAHSSSTSWMGTDSDPEYLRRENREVLLWPLPEVFGFAVSPSPGSVTELERLCSLRLGDEGMLERRLAIKLVNRFCFLTSVIWSDSSTMLGGWALSNSASNNDPGVKICSRSRSCRYL